MATQQPPEQPVYPTAYPYQLPPPALRTSGAAVLSLVFGFLWIFWIGSIAAVVLGHYALKECKEQGKGGDGLAWGGLVLGYIGIAVLVTAIIGAVAG